MGGGVAVEVVVGSAAAELSHAVRCGVIQSKRGARASTPMEGDGFRSTERSVGAFEAASGSEEDADARSRRSRYSARLVVRTIAACAAVRKGVSFACVACLELLLGQADGSYSGRNSFLSIFRNS